MGKEQDDINDAEFRKRWPNGTLRWRSDRPNMANIPRTGPLLQFAAQSDVAEEVLAAMREQIRDDAERAGFTVTEIHDSMIIEERKESE